MGLCGLGLGKVYILHVVFGLFAHSLSLLLEMTPFSLSFSLGFLSMMISIGVRAQAGIDPDLQGGIEGRQPDSSELIFLG